jgi:hypothetical protein
MTHAPNVNDSIVHEYFALACGDYNPDANGDILYEYEQDLADNRKRIATEFNELI